MGKGRVYSAEFREQAMRLAEEYGSASKAARELGIPIDTIHNWRWRAKKGLPAPRTSVSAPEAAANQTDLQEEVRRLRKENEKLGKINEILKRAAALFSQDHLK